MSFHDREEKDGAEKHDHPQEKSVYRRRPRLLNAVSRVMKMDKVTRALQGDGSKASLGTGVHNLEAMYTLSLVFSFAGTIPSSAYAASVYW